MAKVVWEGRPEKREPKTKRYIVQFWKYGIWHTSSESFKTKFSAKQLACGFVGNGLPARVVDTRAEEA